MINRYPKEPPTLAELLADPLLRSLKQSDVARFLGVTERTLRRWKTTGAPRQARLLLWAISLHGADTLQSESDRTASLYLSMAEARAQDCARMARRVEHLQRLGTFGCANDPVSLQPAVIHRAPDYGQPPRPQAEPVDGPSGAAVAHSLLASDALRA